jgi:small subunit ribosomal protein S9
MTTGSHYYYGLGRRKNSVARVRLYPGDGSIQVNGKPAEEWFSRDEQRRLIKEPLFATGMQNSFSAQVKCNGGGRTGWAGAIRLGIARALLVSDEGLRRQLRQAGMLTRDPRAKERKKPGLKRARKAPQYTKR